MKNSGDPDDFLFWCVFSMGFMSQKELQLGIGYIWNQMVVNFNDIGRWVHTNVKLHFWWEIIQCLAKNQKNAT